MAINSIGKIVYEQKFELHLNKNTLYSIFSSKKSSADQELIQKQNEEQTSTPVVMWMEQDVLRRLAGEFRSGCTNKISASSTGTVGNGVALAAATRNWWSQLKTAGAAIYANRHYLSLRQQRHQILNQESLPLPGKFQLTNVNLEGKHFTIGNVYIHPTAQVHCTALVTFPNNYQNSNE